MQVISLEENQPNWNQRKNRKMVNSCECDNFSFFIAIRSLGFTEYYFQIFILDVYKVYRE